MIDDRREKVMKIIKKIAMQEGENNYDSIWLYIDLEVKLKEKNIISGLSVIDKIVF